MPLAGSRHRLVHLLALLLRFAEEGHSVEPGVRPQSILAGLAADRIEYAPYPYVWAPRALDPAYYAELEASFPSFERIAGPGPHRSNEVFRLPGCDVLADPAIPRIWRAFFEYHCSSAFLQEQIAFWRTAIDQEYPQIEAQFGKPLSGLTSGVRTYLPGRAAENLTENFRADAMLDCQFVVNSPVTSPSSVRGSHVDKPYKLFAALLYFRDPEDHSTGGDLLLERSRSGRLSFDRRQHVLTDRVASFAEIPYGPNTLVTWLNTRRSLHSVSPRSVTKVPRRYVNFLTECYTISAEGFFELPRTLPGWLHATAKRAFRHTLIRSAARADRRGALL
jgi:hypothetical protein